MKHYIYLLIAMILFAACGCHRRIESSETLVTKDSVNIRDSIIFKDSVMIRYEYNLIDSVKIRDSMVLVPDSQGTFWVKNGIESLIEIEILRKMKLWAKRS